MVISLIKKHLSLYFTTSVLVTITVLVTVSAKAEILFEGYSKVVSGGVHVGFIVSRYEFDSKKKQFSFTYLMKTNELAGNMLESIKAVSKADLSPVAYAYTSLAGGQTKTIDAKFEGGKFIATVKDGANISKINKALPKGVFLSYFLVYEMLKNPKGITPGTKYEYQAIAEEDGAIVKGMAFVKGVEEFNGIKAYKILNDFKDTKFTSYVSEKGEVLSAKSPVQSISTELVAQSSAATGNFQVPTALLKSLFGEVPLGNKNELANKGAVSSTKSLEIEAPSKPVVTQPLSVEAPEKPKVAPMDPVEAPASTNKPEPIENK